MRATTPVTAWRRVTRGAPCPICHHGDYCGWSADGRAAICMRVMSAHTTRNGGWLHWVSNRPDWSNLGNRRELPVPGGTATTLRASTTDVALLAPGPRRDVVYRALAAELALSVAHRHHLQTVRGLRAGTVDATPFATLPALTEQARRTLAAAVWRRLGIAPDLLAGVPGFAPTSTGWTFASAPAGALVPVPDVADRVQGYQLRADDPRPGQPRYMWLSSARVAGGTSPGVPIAVWRPDLAARGVWVTEGSLKAAIAAEHLPGGACVVGVAGVACWRELPAVLARLLPPDGAVTVAFDADVATNPHVHRHRDALCLALHQAGHAVQVATWEGTRAKGIDDALLAGETVDLAPWRRALPPLVQPHGMPLPAMTRPRGVPLPPIVRPLGVPLSEVAR